MRQMTLVAFLQAQNCTNFVGSWRHPEASPDFMTADYYRHIARVLEAGKFHVGFFDDRLAMPDRYGGDHAHTVANGIRCVKMDPLTILTVMGMATERLGLGATYSTTYYEPFHVARVYRHARPDDQRPRRLEHRHLDERRRSAEHGSRVACRARRALRPRRRVPGSCNRALGFLGRRRNRARQEDRPVRASGQGAPAGPCRRIFSLARTVHRAAFGAGPSGADPGGAERPRASLRGTLGRAGLRQLPYARSRRRRTTRHSSSRSPRRDATRKRCSSPPVCTRSSPRHAPRPRTRWH